MSNGRGEYPRPQARASSSTNLTAWFLNSGVYPSSPGISRTSHGLRQPAVHPPVEQHKSRVRWVAFSKRAIGWTCSGGPWTKTRPLGRSCRPSLCRRKDDETGV